MYPAYLQEMDYQSNRFLAVVSLAEGETLRRLMHTERSQPALDKSGCGLALRTIETMTPIPTTTIADDAKALAMAMVWPWPWPSPGCSP